MVCDLDQLALGKVQINLLQSWQALTYKLSWVVGDTLLYIFHDLLKKMWTMFDRVRHRLQRIEDSLHWRFRFQNTWISILSLFCSSIAIVRFSTLSWRLASIKLYTSIFVKSPSLEEVISILNEDVILLVDTGALFSQMLLMLSHLVHWLRPASCWLVSWHNVKSCW